MAYNHDNDYANAVQKNAAIMQADPSALRGSYAWQVYFITTDGVILLPVCYTKD